MNMNMIMQQAKKMQKNMEKAKDEVSKMTFTASQPLVEVTINGDKKVTNIKLNKDITSDDIEVLEDMILIATNEALDKASKAMKDKMGNVGSGLEGLF
ncbi:MAG: YbaB/EbfC family nucleoid-associated protein [Bacilli bacterium]|nr:YbaB/EbfC family nucleoid-associated protein [Bacilli bacterium]